MRAAIEAAMDAPPHEREAVLERRCKDDPTLLADARSILRAADDSAGFIRDRPTGTSAGDAQLDTGRTLAGRTLGHYRLDQHLASGGMGHVYRAWDLALGRDAAVKVVSRRVGRQLRERLLREAKAAARLQHPAIATFYESGEDQDEAFIAMEFVRGETLRARLRRGPFSFEETLPLASCLLGALGHAHAAGLLHRDIKPENVMVTGSRSAKLLDFGIARRLPSAADALTDTNLTAETALLGTVGYMSPEQILGVPPLDARSDLFQAGIVLYECLTATPAFGGSSQHERLAAALSGDVDLPSLVSHGHPAALCSILARALAQNRERRYPTAMAFLRDLTALQDGQVQTELPRILAVTDFENLNRGDPEADWIGAGIAESLSSDIARASGLEVVPRPKVARTLEALARAHPGSAPRDLELGLALGCGWVVAGAYQKVGPTLRITSRLTDVSTDRVVASEKLDGTLDQIFELQDRLSRAVLDRLSLDSSASAAPAPQAPDVRAYELLTRATSLMTQLKRETVEQAVELLDETLQLAPNYAPAHAALATAFAFRANSTEDLDRAGLHADKAIALDADNAMAHKWKGYALWRRGHAAEATRTLRRAVELNPTDPVVHSFLGSCMHFYGANHDALPNLQRAMELEPFLGFGWLALGSCHLGLLKLAEAKYAFARCLDLESNPQATYPTAGAAAYLGESLRIEGRFDEARQRALEGVESAEASDHSYRDTFRAYGLCVLGRTALQQRDLDAARAAYNQVLAQLRGRARSRGSGHLMVQALAGLGRAGDLEAFQEGLRLSDARDAGNFEFFYGCLLDRELLELARAAQVLGRTQEAETLLERAREAGALEPFEL